MRSAFASARKMEVDFVISQNPVEVTISRTEWLPKDGGREIKKSTVGPFTIRIFYQKGKSYATEWKAPTPGIRQTNETYAFIAAANVDIQCSSDIRDELTAYGRRFLVSGVVPRYWDGELLSIDGTLEEVS